MAAIVTLTTYILVSALSGDAVPGIEVSDPECPVDITAHPAALAWARAQGWGIDDDELVYVVDPRVDDVDAVPSGSETFRLDVETAPVVDAAALITPTTRAIVASAAEAAIEREYGADRDVVTGATMIATAAITQDIAPAWIQTYGSDRGLRGTAEAQLRIMVRDALEARRCQCLGTPSVRCSHAGRCSGHTEADVPPTSGGTLLCGGCYCEWTDV